MALVDITYLSQVMFGDEEAIADVIVNFLESTPSHCNKLKQAIDNVDFSSIREIAHSLKTSLRIVGADKLSNWVKQIETNYTNLETVRVLYTDLIEYITTVYHELRLIINDYTK